MRRRYIWPLIAAQLLHSLEGIFALPEPAQDPLYGGCHCLIREGVQLVVSLGEVIENIIAGSKTLLKAPRMAFLGQKS